ncbi:uncharacterized protein LOC123902382 isoform X2 [Trifolium pratense]|uniref:uncharacterized protein LOC123902382 isoform X2 n=1 Tax=Trifolium pratense TaxID=57577 RepID=UPI001E696422|nr:uncharacterized protein LOC123902382 isoform X2 [Trifolium pratense]
MSDLCSPMIILLDDESDAFWCFERLMRRYRGNFRCIGRTLGVEAQASYYIWNPAIHDIVTFRDPTQHCEDNTDVNFIKRVVAKEGNTVERNDGNACVDAGTNKVNATSVTKPKKPLLKHLGLQRRTSGSLKNCNVKNLKGSGSSSNVPLVIDDDADAEAEPYKVPNEMVIK